MLRVGSRLPALTLMSVAGTRVPLRGGHGPRVVLAIHAAHCPHCARYVRGLHACAARFEEWRARVLVVVPGTSTVGEVQRLRGATIDVLIDQEEVLARGDATVLIADEWGEVHQAFNAGREHALPQADELVHWMRFLSIQCPECEGPEGEWRGL